MKILFHCTTEFQLLSAISIRYHLMRNDECDIIVDNYHGQEKLLAERIRSTGLFSHVAHVRSEIEHATLHKYFRDLIEGKHEVSLLSAFGHTIKFIKMLIQKKIFGEKAYIEQMIAGIEKLDLDHYDRFVAYGTKPSTINLALYQKKHNAKCRFFTLDEGIGSYYEPQIAEFRVKVSGAFLYEPDLKIFDTLPTYRIPRLDPQDKKFLNMVNHVFAYHGPKGKRITDKAIFFDQGVSSAMPVYLKKMPQFTRILFYNSYKKHKKEEQHYREELAFDQDVLLKIEGKEVWVKLHPRTSEDIKEVWRRQNKVHVISGYGVPWELYVLNNCFDHNIFITYTSSSVCMINACIKGMQSNRAILCYPMHKKAVDKGTSILLPKISARYSNVYIAQSMINFRALANDNE